MAGFARFLADHGYTTTMWENGFHSEDANEVCQTLSQWFQEKTHLDGEFLIIWGALDGVRFSGDAELAYFDGQQAYVMPNPFLEGNGDAFVAALDALAHDRKDLLYPAEIQKRILFNAV